MVFLTMTTAMVEALEKLNGFDGPGSGKQKLSTKLGDPKESPQRPDNRDLERDKGNDQIIDGAGGDTFDSETLITEIELAEPSLSDPRVGKPISHGQILDLSKELKSRGMSPRDLDALLRGSRVYNSPPKPKVEPVSSPFMSDARYDSWLTNHLFRRPNT